MRGERQLSGDLLRAPMRLNRPGLGAVAQQVYAMAVTKGVVIGVSTMSSEVPDVTTWAVRKVTCTLVHADPTGTL